MAAKRGGRLEYMDERGRGRGRSKSVVRFETGIKDPASSSEFKAQAKADEKGEYATETGCRRENSRVRFPLGIEEGQSSDEFRAKAKAHEKDVRSCEWRERSKAHEKEQYLFENITSRRTK